MEIVFSSSAVVAVLATVMVITRHNAIHALLYLITAFLAVAVVFFALGAPFVAVLEVIIYAGAIMVLFLFVVMMLNIGPHTVMEEHHWFSPRMLLGPAILGAILLAEMLYVLLTAQGTLTAADIAPPQVGALLFGPYVVGVELASLLLLAGLVGAFHLARREGS